MRISVTDIKLEPTRKKPKRSHRTFSIDKLPIDSEENEISNWGTVMKQTTISDFEIGEIQLKGYYELDFDGALDDLNVAILVTNRIVAVQFVQNNRVLAQAYIPRSSGQIESAMRNAVQFKLHASGSISCQRNMMVFSVVFGIPPQFDSKIPINLIEIWWLFSLNPLPGVLSLPENILFDPPTKIVQESDYQFKSLLVNLYPYQKKTVHWLLYKEGVSVENGELKAINTPRFHPLVWVKLSENCYLNQITGDLHSEILHDSLGGILCDEMGMGKTLMIVSVVLFHKLSSISYPSLQSINLEPAVCKATLIVTPKSILSQWISEIEKHAPSLDFFVYEGNECDIQDLDHVDIVFTHYDVMKKELHLSSSGRDGLRRGGRTYNRRQSFLMSRTWWRVVLDESQMVESFASAAAQMARKIPRIHPWSVTGTPTPKRGAIEEMQGLFLFIDAPINCSYLNRLFPEDCKDILSHYIHKQTKDHVKNEMILPIQRNATYYIPFKPVELQYYDDLVEMALKDLGPEPQKPLSIADSLEWTPELEAATSKSWKEYQEVQSVRFAKMQSWLLRLRQTWYFSIT
jgi:SNF2 family DNA or RNA helicase